MDEERAKKMGIKPLVRVLSYADAEVQPQAFCACPHVAAKIALERISLSAKDIDFFEIHEAFAMTVLLNMKVYLFFL